MRLAAIYVPSGILTHIFGKSHTGQTINLGGKFTYTFEEGVNERVHLKEKTPNTTFIPDFWLNNIQLISAIVGENGTGKTTIVNSFREPYSFCKFIYESLNSDEHIISDDANSSEVIYYSPFFNINQSNSENENFRDLSKYQIMIDDTEHENLDLSTLLELYNSENLKRWIKFIELNNTNGLLKKMSLPVFNKIKVKINYIHIKPHDTSYHFRPFFQAFSERIDEERIDREQAIIDRIGIDEFRKNKLGNKIRLELEVIKRVISKTQNVLESSGNKYLQEGFIENSLTAESEEIVNQPNAKEAFYWFLENAFIRLTNESEKIRFPATEIKKLIETILSYLPQNEVIENYTEFNVNFSQAREILRAYEEFLVAFKNNFTYDKKVLLSFRPAKNLSSGEKSLYDLFSALNDFNYRVKKKIHTAYSGFHKRENVTDNILILLDEADLGFHPEWKKKYTNIIQQVIPFIFKNKNIQIIITTHDPLTLSDLPNGNIVYLKKTELKGRTKVLGIEDAERPTRTFGANISDLLADSFFIGDELIGDFAKEKISATIRWINDNEDEVNRNQETFEEELDYNKKVISIIDEPIVKIKLSEMISDLEEANTFQRQVLDDEIKFLTEKRDRLK